MKLIHLVHDEKFIHFIADVFNLCEGTTNYFWVVVANPSAPLKYVAGIKNMRVIDKRHIQSRTLVDELEQCNAVVVHYLDILKARIVAQAPKDIPIMWSGWGGDYYDYLPISHTKLLGVETENVVARLTQKSTIMKRVRSYFKSLLRQIIYGRVMSNAIHRMNYFSAPIPDDFDLIKKHINLVAEYRQINYASVENTFMQGPQSVTGVNILVGNSSSSTNNHLEIFQKLTKIDLGSRKVIVPLSYGDTDYRDAIIRHGRNMLGECFQPIVDFVPIEQYNSMIAECSVVVMGHRRQQAIGNIATMLFKGAKVFLDEKTTSFQFFKERGIYIYGLKQLEAAGLNMFEPLTNEQQKKNRNEIERFWGHDVVLKNARKLVETFQTHKGEQRA